MNAHEKTFGSPEGEPSTTRSMLQQMCEKVWTLPLMRLLRACSPFSAFVDQTDSGARVRSSIIAK